MGDKVSDSVINGNYVKYDIVKIMLSLMIEFQSAMCDYNSLCIDYRAERCEITVILFGFILPDL